MIPVIPVIPKIPGIPVVQVILVIQVTQVIRLSVSGAFHSPLMESARRGRSGAARSTGEGCAQGGEGAPDGASEAEQRHDAEGAAPRGPPASATHPLHARALAAHP